MVESLVPQSQDGLTCEESGVEEDDGGGNGSNGRISHFELRARFVKVQKCKSVHAKVLSVLVETQAATTEDFHVGVFKNLDLDYQ